MAAGSIVGTIAAYAAIASAAAGIAATAYSATQSAPKAQSASSASREVANAQASALPLQRTLQALEQQGGRFESTNQTLSLKAGSGKGKLNGLGKDPEYQALKDSGGFGWTKLIGGQDKGPSEAKLLLKSVKKSGDKEGAKIIKQAIKDAKKSGNKEVTVYKDASGRYVPASIGTADFTGYGTADIEGKLARQNADNQIALGDKYGVQYAEEARKQAELADPEGTAARKAEYEMIQRSLENPLPVNPLAKTLETGVRSQLAAGSRMDAGSQSLLDEAVASANATRGGGATSQAVADDIASGWEGRARKEAGIKKAQAFLSSGSTPADIQERRQQQDLANLSNFVGGRTPQSQFGALSTAGQGAAPYVQGQQGATMPGNAGQVGNAYSTAAYSADVNSTIAQANPWMAGLSSLLSASSAANKIAGA